MENYLYGLDLSLAQTGITIFDLNALKPVHITSIKTKSNWTHGKRLKVIGDYINSLRNKYPPRIIVIERGFTKFHKVTQALYRIVGVTEYIFNEFKPVFYPPTTVKATILGGKAGKELIRRKIEQEYPDVIFKNEDESDSFAVALTYLIKNKLIEWNKKLKTESQ